MNIKITNLLKQEIKYLGKECDIELLKIKIKHKEIPDSEVIIFSEKKYEIYQRKIEDDKEGILSYYIWLLAINTLLKGIEQTESSLLQQASNLFAWCQVRLCDENSKDFDADAPFLLCSYMSNGFKYLARAVYSLQVANQNEDPYKFDNGKQRGFNYILCLMDFVMADHILKNEKRQVNAPNDLLVALHEQIEIIKYQCYVDMLIVNVCPTLSVISSNEDKASFFIIFSYIRDKTKDEETKKVYTTLINSFNSTLEYYSSFSTLLPSRSPTSEILCSILDKYKKYERIPNNNDMLKLYQPSIKRTPFPFIPNPIIFF